MFLDVLERTATDEVERVLDSVSITELFSQSYVELSCLECFRFTVSAIVTANGPAMLWDELEGIKINLSGYARANR